MASDLCAIATAIIHVPAGNFRHPDLARQFAANEENRMSRNSPPWRTWRRRGDGEAVKKLESSAIPLLASLQGGGPSDSENIARIRLSRGRGGFPMNPKGKPPQLRLLRWLRQIFFDDAATPPCGGARRGITPYHN